MPVVHRAIWPLLAAALLVANAAGVDAQQPSRDFASPFLPASHWSVDAARRLSTLGLADREFGWGDGSLTRAAVGRVLEGAVVRARLAHPDLERMALGYWTRFQREFPLTAAMLRGDETHISSRAAHPEGWASVGYAGARGRVFPVRSLDRTRENTAGPFSRSNLSDPAGEVNVSFPLGRYAAIALAPERRDGDWHVGESHIAASWRKIGIWAGQRAPAYGPGAGGGIVFNGTAVLTGGGFGFVEPFRLPWILRYLGPIRYEALLTNVDSNAAVRHPWIVAQHASISPHPRVLIGLTQAFMFGGEGVGPFTWRNFKEMFLSHAVHVTGTEFENGIAAAEFRFRPPVPVVPLELYLEWGADDNHAAWTLFPGVVAGMRVPAVPGVPALSLGLERAYFAGPCRPGEANCHSEYYATWYRHYVFMDGWTLDRQPMGHPLGGEGTEWLAYGKWDDPVRPLRLDGRLFVRDRGSYNIYAPSRAGHSYGGQMDVTYRATSALDLVLDGAYEHGDAGWSETHTFGGIRWVF